MTTTSTPQPADASSAPLGAEEQQVRRVQRRTITVLSIAQILSGLGSGAMISTGALLAEQLTGSAAWSGSATTTMTIGAAFAAAWLSRFAMQRGRRASLTLGLLIATAGTASIIFAAVTSTFWLLIVGGLLVGAGNAANLQARFAATDLSQPEHRGRDLSLVVWMSTLGAVTGPNLVGWGGSIAQALGLPALTGLFLVATVGMFASMIALWFGLRPDPLLLARARQEAAIGEVTTPTTAASHRSRGGFVDGVRALFARTATRIATIGILTAHLVMVAVMSMTPVHLGGHGASVELIGLTVSLHIAGMYALAPVMGMLADRIGALWVVYGGLVLLGVSAIVTGTSGAEAMQATVGMILLGLAWSAVTVAGSAVIVQRVDAASLTSAQGASDSLMSLAGGVGGALAGVTLALVGFEGLGQIAALLSFAALIVTGMMRMCALRQGGTCEM